MPPVDVPAMRSKNRTTGLLSSSSSVARNVAGKIPLSLGKNCPVKCEFCYEIDHSYRETLDPPKTSDEDWKFILDYINKKPTDPLQFWCLGGNEYMEWTDLFLHPKAMEWVEDFLKYTDKNVQFFTVGFVHVPKIHQLAAQYPGRINFELSVITLGAHRQQLMPHAPSVKHVLKVLDGPAVSSANFYSFDHHTMSEDARAISAVTCWHSSRVGVRTRAWTAFSDGSTCSTIGMPKAAVFPVPVWAWPMRSCPARSDGIERAWTSVGVT